MGLAQDPQLYWQHCLLFFIFYFIYFFFLGRLLSLFMPVLYPHNTDGSLNFLGLAYLLTLLSPRMGSGYYFEFAECLAQKGPRLQKLH